jgi:hypothetical protein
MNNVVTVENTEMQIREYNGQRVVTFKDIDTVHQNKDGTAKRNFSRNKKYLIDGEDYYFATRDFSKSLNLSPLNIDIPTRGITLLTETGYLMLVKSFRDDLAWKVQRQLVKSYFQKPLLNLAEKYKRPVSNCPAPLATDFYNTNWEKISCCKRANSLPESDILDVVFAYVSRKYDFDIAERMYEDQVGHKPKNRMDVLDFFPEMKARAQLAIDGLYGNALKMEEEKSK